MAQRDDWKAKRIDDWTMRQEQQPERYDFSGLKTTKGRAYNEDNLNYIYRKLTERGMDNIRAAAILGTIAEESGGNPYATSPDTYFEGLMQWDRRNRYHINPLVEESQQAELDRQLDYLFSTIDDVYDKKSWTHGGEGSGYNSNKEAQKEFADTDDLYRAVYALNRGYVRPTGKNDSVDNRHRVAEQIYGRITAPQPPESIRKPSNMYADGGHKIHIKPENRGKFTALKERTGHSATWFKENGTPAQRKMATFALNAKKWNR